MSALTPTAPVRMPVASNTPGESLEDPVICIIDTSNILICVPGTATTIFSTPTSSFAETITVTYYVTPTPTWHAANGSMPVSYSAAQITTSHGHGHWMMATMALGGVLFTVLCGIAWWAWRSRQRKRRLACAVSDKPINSGREITRPISPGMGVSSSPAPLQEDTVEDDIEKGRATPALEDNTDAAAGIARMPSAHLTLSSRRATVGSHATVLLPPPAHARRSLCVLPSQNPGPGGTERSWERRQAMDGGVWLAGGPQTPRPPLDRPSSMPPLPPLPPPLPRTSHDLSLYRTITASTGADSHRTLPPPYGTFSD